MKRFKIPMILALGLLLNGGSRAWANIMPPKSSCEDPLLRTFLEFKLTGSYFKKQKEFEIDVPALNKKLRARKLAEFPETLTIGATAGKVWDDLMKRIDSASEAWGNELHLTIDQAYLYQMPPMCYHGDPGSVLKLIEKLGGKFFQEDQGYMAFRHGSVVKNLDPENLGKTEAESRERFPDAAEKLNEWFGENPHSSDVLVLSNLGPQGDGTELYVTRIQRCPSI